MEYRWEEIKKPSSETVNGLATSLGIDLHLAQMLVQRDVSTFDEAKAFFRPDLKTLHDPFLMKDMDVAVERIQKAIDNNERIMVYGDYDVDGTTAVALVSSYLRTFYKNVDTYIPDRYKEGYGVSSAGIDYAAESNCKLIIALDCGIKAVDKVAYAKSKGVEFIICDHHRPGDVLPEATAILDPKRKDCNYPYDELSGAGVGFKLVQALHERRGLDFEDLKCYLDMLCVSIGSDIVPITGENRVLAHCGLYLLNTNPRPAFRNFIKEANKSWFTITDVVFILGPRINAAGRIEHGKLAVELLSSEDPKKIDELSALINEHNDTRKVLDKSITGQALEMIEENGEKERKSTVVYHEDWHKGVIGIVASRLTENYYRPTVVFTKSNGKLAGSARSVKGFDVYNALDACSDILEQFGGHMYAAGMTLKPERFEEFKAKFEEVVESTIDPELLIPVINYDQEIELQDIGEKFHRILKQFAPFGPKNMAPVFLTKNVKNYRYSKAVGADKDHLKLDLIEEGSGVLMSGIAFGLGHLAEEILSGKTFSIVYHLEENEWNGNISKQLRVLDLKFSND